MKKAVIIASILLPLGMLVWFVGMVTYGRSPPREADLLQQFHANRETFEALKHMLQEDVHVCRIGNHGVEYTNDTGIGTRPITEVGFSADRYAVYTSALSKAGAYTVVRDGENLRFVVARWGGDNKGWRIAYTYRDTPPTNTIDNLDNFKKTSRDWEHAYRPIKDGWYLWINW